MRTYAAAFSAIYLLLATATSQAAISGLERVASGLSAPIFVTHAPGDTSRLFIAQRGGAIRILNLTTGTLEPTPFLSISGITTTGEGGLLGMAFHPDYYNEAADGYGKFYVKVTTASPFTARILEFTTEGNPNLPDPFTRREVLTYTNPQTNHVGGWIGFSPNNKYLYIANGDGGGGFDGGDGSPGHTAGTGNAQDITNNWLGKILRIDPLDPDGPLNPLRYSIPPTNPMVAGVGNPADDVGDDEIWAYGLRNPFRNSFDRLTGDLWIGDVGQGQREEIDFEAAASEGGLNFGWRYREGFVQTAGVGLPYNSAWTQPVFDYNRDNDPFGGTVVTGGYVYRGPDPSLQGQYFFLDSRNTPSTGDDNYWMFDPANPFGTVENINDLLTPDVGFVQFPVSFGEDALGNLYIAYITSGEVYRIATDELLDGDYNADGKVDAADYVVWRKTDGTQTGYDTWAANFGRSVHDQPGAASGPVPEPATAAIIGQLLALSLLAARTRPTSPKR